MRAGSAHLFRVKDDPLPIGDTSHSSALIPRKLYDFSSHCFEPHRGRGHVALHVNTASNERCACSGTRDLGSMRYHLSATASRFGVKLLLSTFTGLATELAWLFIVRACLLSRTSGRLTVPHMCFLSRPAVATNHSLELKCVRV